jgi:hypothetical protein
MANFDSGYFGMQIGDALSAGAGHISSALQRKYEMQRKEQAKQEELARQQGAQKQTMQMGFAAKGIDYDPNNPAAAFEALRAQSAGNMAQQAKGVELGQKKTQADIDAMGQPKPLTPPPGFRPNATGLEPIPGGPAAIKIEEDRKAEAEAKSKEEGNKEEFVGTLDRGLAAIEDTIKDISYWNTGLLGVDPEKPSMWNMSANEMAAKIQHIESIIGLKTIEKMKAQSRTGATGFGQLSVKELGLLTSNIANIKTNLNRPDALKKNLKEVADVLNIWKDRTLKAEEDTAPGSMARPESTIALPPDKAQRLQELRAKAGR